MPGQTMLSDMQAELVLENILCGLRLLECTSGEQLRVRKVMSRKEELADLAMKMLAAYQSGQPEPEE